MGGERRASSGEVGAEAELNNEQVIFKVQIETNSIELTLEDAKFKGMPVWMYQNNGLYKYTIGAYDSFKTANELKKKMRDHQCHQWRN